MVEIELPAPLREFADDAIVAVEAATVGQALAALTARYPRLRRHLYDDAGQLRSYVNLYVNEEPASPGGAGGDTPLAPGDTVIIVPSVAGGRMDPLEAGARRRARTTWNGESKA
jgi:sulfur-carrier protein adenylyltransferase/sulfurtransferase